MDAPGDFTSGGVHDVLRSYDIVCANLENPVATAGRPCPGQDPNVTFRAHPDSLDVLLSSAMISNYSSFLNAYYHTGRPSLHIDPVTHGSPNYRRDWRWGDDSASIRSTIAPARA